MVCLRFFTVYGPRQRPDLAIYKFTRAIAAGNPIELFGDGSARRDYTYIDDILQGIMAGVERTFGFELINLGESQTTALRDLVVFIEQAVGRKAVVRKLPPQPGDVPVTFADIAKARRLLDYNPQVKIEDGIPRFVEWFRAGCQIRLPANKGQA
jgi:UDP-glucuronate 4-epimerase